MVINEQQVLHRLASYGLDERSPGNRQDTNSVSVLGQELVFAADEKGEKGTRSRIERAAFSRGKVAQEVALGI
jgi:hypothetical protein